MLRLLLISTIFIFSGCSSKYKSADIDYDKPLPQSYGVVALHLTSNTDKLNAVTSKWDKIYVVRLDNLEDAKQRAIDSAIKKESLKNFPQKIDTSKVKWEPDTYVLSPLYKGVIGSQIFVGAVPEGRYAISRLYSQRSDGQFIYTMKMKVMRSAGFFPIKAKALTNLGTIVFQPLLDINDPSFWYRGHNAFVTRLNTSDRLGNFVINNYPNLAKNLTNDQVYTWENDDADAIRFKLGNLSKEFPFSEKAISLEGRAIGGLAGRLGQFQLLKDDKSWRQISFPTNSQIYSALPYEDGQIFGGEFGELFIKSSTNSNLEKISPVNATEVIVWMGSNKESNYALTKSHNNYYIYKFSNPKEPWENISNLEQESSFWVQNGNIFAFINKQGNLTIISDGKRKIYNSLTKEWSTFKNDSLVKLSRAKDGTLLGLEVSQWDGIGDQTISFDDGETWNSFDRNLKWNGDHTADKSLPGILADGRIVTLGRKPKDKGVKAEDHDDGMKIITIPKSKINSPKEWIYHGFAYGECHNLLPELTYDTTVYFLCPRGKVISTSDFGQTWNTELEIDYSIMQREFKNSFLNLN